MTKKRPVGTRAAPQLPVGATPEDPPAWRFAFRLAELGLRNNDKTGRTAYVRITIWAVTVMAVLALLLWLAGPWASLGGGALYGITKGTRALYQRSSQKRQRAEQSDHETQTDKE